jgi:hypothetical protein
MHTWFNGVATCMALYFHYEAQQKLGITVMTLYNNVVLNDFDKPLSAQTFYRCAKCHQ